MTAAALVALVILFASAVLLGARAVIGPSLADRVLSIDALVSVLAGGLAVAAVWSGETRYLDGLLVIVLVGFVGTVTVARFIEEQDVGAMGAADRSDDDAPAPGEAS